MESLGVKNNEAVPEPGVIDRRALVSRHNPTHRNAGAALEAPLSVGNGRFCFTVDATGLQTFSGGTFPRLTMAEWFWRRYPDAPEDDAALRLTPFDSYGREVFYATDDAGQEALFRGLRQNAHKGNLARLGFAPDAVKEDFALERQTLDLWQGVITTEFTFSGGPVRVETLVSPRDDTVCVRVLSGRIQGGRVPPVEIAFPYPTHKKEAGDFTMPERHLTVFKSEGSSVLVTRVIDGTRFFAQVTAPGGEFSFAPERRLLTVTGRGASLELFLRFSREEGEGAASAASFETEKRRCADFWQSYWEEGAALELAPTGGGDAETELERRIVLSRYLCAIQGRGDYPPAETGLTCNSWYGKFHLEMHPLHAAHFALWGRSPDMEKSLAFYRAILPEARRIAARQGYAGARWPKMCDPSGYNSPSSIAPLLVWQQPHPIALACLAYNAQKTEAAKRALLACYRDVVAESAEFMASFVHYDDKGAAHIGPPCIPVQERFDPATVQDPAFETVYWRWGLRAASAWMERLGEAPGPAWARAADALPPPAVRDGLCLAHAACPETFSTPAWRTDHPSMLMAGILGGLPTEVMAATLDAVLETWDRETLWGWDFPVLALAAASLGRFEEAVNLLLLDSPKNTFLANGHNRQGAEEALPCYLPGNGALLLASALMAGRGWFPRNWRVRAEGFDLCKNW